VAVLDGVWNVHVTAGPAGNYVQDLEIDREGRVWCATGTRWSDRTPDMNIGVLRFDGSEWERITKPPLVSGTVYCLDSSPADGSMWLGFWGSGLMSYDLDTDQWETHTSILVSPVVSDIWVGPRGNVFFGEYPVGLGILCSDGTDLHYSVGDSPPCLETMCITSIGPGPSGALIGPYISPDEGCLDMVTHLDIGQDCGSKLDDFCEAWASVEGWEKGWGYDSEVDLYGVTWLATSGGISCYEDRWRTLYDTWGEVWDIEVDAHGTKWVATDEGIYVLKGYGTTRQHFEGSLERYDSSNSPLDDSPVKALAFDADGALWIGTGGGAIYKFTQPRDRPKKQWVEVFPSKYYAWEDEDGKGIRFTGFLPGSMIRIYTIAGDLVAEVDPERAWHATNMEGEDLVSGVYVYHGYAHNGNEFIGRFVVVR
jgi:hypothetical protein